MNKCDAEFGVFLTIAEKGPVGNNPRERRKRKDMFIRPVMHVSKVVATLLARFSII
jgi:hypothetical protein